jgi:metallophosphoesterase (TIGR00282 family)
VDSIKILFIGEIVGKSGVFCVKKLLAQVRKEHAIDFVIANGEGATGGYGIGKNHSIYLHKLGIDCITSGECIYYKRDMVDHIRRSPYILRPVNYPYDNPGRGWMVYEKDGFKIGVINILGQAGFDRIHLANPYHLLPEIANRVAQQTNIIIVDFHASASAEKIGMFLHMDGKVAAVLGTHTKVLTADETVLPGGTAVITDTGRTGAFHSVGGLDPEIEIRKYLTQIQEYSKESWEKLAFQGVVIEAGTDGKARSIERIHVPYEGETNERDRDGEER